MHFCLPILTKISINVTLLIFRILLHTNISVINYTNTQTEIFSESCKSKQNLDCNYTFPNQSVQCNYNPGLVSPDKVFRLP